MSTDGAFQPLPGKGSTMLNRLWLWLVLDDPILHLAVVL